MHGNCETWFESIGFQSLFGHAAFIAGCQCKSMPRQSAEERMHLADISLFYAPESGGVKTYLMAKAHWVKQNTCIRHSIIAPAWGGSRSDSAIIPVPSVPIPFVGGYRMPRSIKTGVDLLRRMRVD